MINSDNLKWATFLINVYVFICIHCFHQKSCALSLYFVFTKTSFSIQCGSQDSGVARVRCLKRVTLYLIFLTFSTSCASSHTLLEIHISHTRLQANLYHTTKYKVPEETESEIERQRQREIDGETGTERRDRERERDR